MSVPLSIASKLNPKFVRILRQFQLNYLRAIEKSDFKNEEIQPIFDQYLTFIFQQAINPHSFELFHQRITEPFNYTKFGQDLVRPLIQFSKSTVLGKEALDKISNQIERGENVVLFANHQTEPDPQIIQLLLGKSHPELADEIIFVAGHRVTSDPLAIPFSLGCNLLCIYSKKHIESPAEEKQRKQLHNKRTMKKMCELLQGGGKCIYVAPSGGRDRPDADGNVGVSPFDPQSIDMFFLMAKRAKTRTNFYPLALATYDLLPPPNSVDVELGEHRNTSCCPVHLSFGDEIFLKTIPGMEIKDKWERRQAQSDYIWNLVKELYSELG